MRFNWKSYKISLEKFNNFLTQTTTNSDGISADEDGFTIIEKMPFTSEEKFLIQNYYDNLLELEEIEFLKRPIYIRDGYEKIKLGLLEKSYSDMNTLEKKIFLNIKLDESEINQLIDLGKQNG